MRACGSDDVLRVGWAMSGFRPDPAVGVGVGDDIFSWAFDGKSVRTAGREWVCSGSTKITAGGRAIVGLRQGTWWAASWT